SQIVVVVIAGICLLMGLGALIEGWKNASIGNLVAGVCSVALGLGLAYIFLDVIPRHKKAPFQNHLNEYTSSVSRTLPGEPYIKGKVILINKKENKVDDLFFSLPEELRPSTPEEVGTVVWLEWGERQVGYYGSKDSSWDQTFSPATMWHCDVTIIDLSIPAILINKKYFVGSAAPSTS